MAVAIQGSVEAYSMCEEGKEAKGYSVISGHSPAPSIVPLNHTDSRCNYDLLHPLACKCTFIMARSGLSDSGVRLYQGKVQWLP